MSIILIFFFFFFVFSLTHFPILSYKILYFPSSIINAKGIGSLIENETTKFISKANITSYGYTTHGMPN